MAKLYLLGPPRVGLRWKNVTPKCSYLPPAEGLLQAFPSWGMQGSPLDHSRAGAEHQPSQMCGLQLWRRNRWQKQSNSPKIRVSVCAFKKKNCSVICFFFFCMGAILLLDKPLCAGSVLINKRGLAYNHFSSWGRGTQACSLCNYFNT